MSYISRPNSFQCVGLLEVEASLSVSEDTLQVINGLIVHLERGHPCSGPQKCQCERAGPRAYLQHMRVRIEGARVGGNVHRTGDDCVIDQEMLSERSVRADPVS